MKQKSISWIQCETTTTCVLVAIVSVIAALLFASAAEAVVPAPDGGYPNWNTAEGQDALLSLTTGAYNTALGGNALRSNTTGNFNTASGLNALLSNTMGTLNTATGAQALIHNTTGTWNTASGVNALYTNRTGHDNTATGVQALYSNTTGYDNTANGTSALFSNTEGYFNTASGFQALSSNTTAHSNTATGFQALQNNTIGYRNIAMGSSALQGNIIGHDNTATGDQALRHNTGNFNIALGSLAGINLSSGSNNIDIGNPGISNDSSTIRIGVQDTQARTFIAGISGTAVSGTAVTINSNGQLGVAPSSRRFKNDIKRMDKISEGILALKPVTFRYNKEIDPKTRPQFGLVAEEVARVNPDLVVCNENGKIYTVRYDAVNAMLLNEFLKEHEKVGQLIANAARQQRQIDELAAGVRKVSEQLELQKRTRQVVLNDR